MNRPKLYIVTCIDTEGPANYALDTWEKVDGIMGLIGSQEYRNRFRDCAGNGLKLSYFVMDWTGFDENPTGRQLGYGHILGHYERTLFGKIPAEDHCVCWHYHHPFADRKWRNGGWNNDWLDNREYENQINRLILDRKHFPSVYRAGGTIETDEQSGWLEKWIPFDFSSRAPHPTFRYYLRNLRSFVKKGIKRPLWDWSRAPRTWSAYRPSGNDYQAPGDSNRMIFRCLDIESGSYRLGRKDIREAFNKAREDGLAVCAFFTHDFYASAANDITRALSMIKDVSASFTDVDFEYETALGAARKFLARSSGITPVPGLELEVEIKDRTAHITANRDIYSKAPWVVVADTSGRYERIEAENTGKLSWTAPLGNRSVIRIGAAAVDRMGYQAVKVIDI